jgi:hypothetical protein
MNVLMLGGGIIQRLLGYEGKALTNRIYALPMKIPQTYLLYPFTSQGLKEKVPSMYQETTPL